MSNAFDYAVLRIVPSVERGEFFNVGVILFSAQLRFLDARVHLHPEKLAALNNGPSTEEVAARLDAVLKLCSGEPSAGPIAQLSQRARFHWLVAPRSTWLQISPVHSGLCEDPQTTLERLFREQVL